MSETADGGVAGVHAALDAALDRSLGGVESAVLLAELGSLGRAASRLAALQHRLLAEIEARRLAGDYGGTRTTAELLGAVQQIGPKVAREAVELALSLTPGRTLTGEPLDPIAPATAAASRAGEVTAAQAQIIVETLDAVPAWLGVEDVAIVEKLLLQAAACEHPAALRVTARQLLARLDQDGPEPTDPTPAAVRRLRIVRRRDGRRQLQVDLDAAEEALLRTVLDPLAAPRPAGNTTSDTTGGDTRGGDTTAGIGGDTVPDPRLAGERDHDALVEVLHRVLCSDTLGTTNGAPVTILATTTLTELQAGRGLAHTEHGDSWPLPGLLQFASEAEILPVVLDRLGAVLCLGRSIRLATVLQRRALTARDRGCSFPGCTRPASWCQVHHVLEWQHGGTTDIDNLCLLCAYHHRVFAELGWQVVMTDGLPHWIPPPWLDPERRPVRNTANHPPEIEFLRAERSTTAPP